jgi:hypothetical protein
MRGTKLWSFSTIAESSLKPAIFGDITLAESIVQLQKLKRCSPSAAGWQAERESGQVALLAAASWPGAAATRTAAGTTA